MPYIVAGTLTLPESTKPATNVTITFRNLMTVSPLIVASESSVTTSATGTYSISLQYSVYAVEVTYYNNRPISAGQIVLNSETQTGLDLPTLLNGGEYEPATPAWILQIEAWLVESQNSANASANSAQAAQAQANASAASAAASAASAAQASQISGLDTVAEAIGLAALPLPDVWAPLSDSLRMITGYGRDVLVGSDVVARMVNFSRNTAAAYVGKDGQWKNAAANEPRFEIEGLLIEGQSTNVFNSGLGANYSWISEGLTQSAGTAPLPFDVFQKTITSSTSNPTHIGRVLVDIYGKPNPAASGGGPVTLSAIMFGDADAIIAAEPRLHASLTITGVINSTVKLTSRMVRVVWTGIITAGSAANFVNFQLSWLNRLPSVVAGCYQIEALPFASSYIPTNGAAATRAADRAYILWENNMPLSVANAVSFAVEATPYKSPAPESRTVLDLGVASALIGIRPDNTLAWIGINNKGSLVDLNPNEATYRIVARYDGSFLTAGNNGVIGTRSAYTVDGDRSSTRYMRIGTWAASNTGWETAKYGTYRCIWGHIRNIRIWHSALTDEQMKAIR